jgi:hypothetical protein
MQSRAPAKSCGFVLFSLGPELTCAEAGNDRGKSTLSRSYAVNQGGLFLAVLAEDPSTVSSTAITNNRSVYRLLLRSCLSLLRTAFQPYGLALAGLAFAIVFWGFGYRLSSYMPNASSRCVKVKLWDKQQTLAPESVAPVAPNPEQHAAELASATESAIRPLPSQADTPVRIAIRFARFQYLSPLRSPPLETIA